MYRWLRRIGGLRQRCAPHSALNQILGRYGLAAGQALLLRYIRPHAACFRQRTGGTSDPLGSLGRLRHPSDQGSAKSMMSRLHSPSVR